MNNNKDNNNDDDDDNNNVGNKIIIIMSKNVVSALCLISGPRQFNSEQQQTDKTEDNGMVVMVMKTMTGKTMIKIHSESDLQLHRCLMKLAALMKITAMMMVIVVS